MRSPTLVTLSLLLLASCGTSQSPDCANGDSFQRDGKTLCMYRTPVVIEEGFACPPEADHFTTTDGGGVCSPEGFGGDPTEAWEEWSAQSPDEPDEGEWVREEPPEGADPEDQPPLDEDEVTDPGFAAVADLLRQNCLLGGCHGNPPGAAQVFQVRGGMNATDAEIAEILASRVFTNSGNYLIDPGRPETSEIFVRITKPAGDVQLMGAGTYGGAATRLSSDRLDEIEAWIAAGAQFAAQ